MSTKKLNNCNCDTEQEQMKIENLTLNDGRKAERHVSTDENGNEIVEIFAEEKRPLKLEKRILREMKSIVAKETHQTVADGEITYEEVHSLEPETPLQIRSKLGIADHAKVVDGDYVRKDEIQSMISEGVVAGVSALMENMEPLISQSRRNLEPVSNERPEPIFKAQEIVENNVQEKNKSSMVVNVALGLVVVVQLVFFAAYMLL